MDKTEELLATDAPTADSRPSRPSFSEFTLAGFKIGEVLGRGGMGVVYAAEQMEPRRRVAIKVLHLQSPNALVRFKTEAQVMARLDHPGIARVFQSGDSVGMPYLVMEHVDGVEFDDYVEELPLHVRLELFVQVCDAVHHAHIKGVIHRDLKPSNIMVRPPDRVVVLDFGIARLEDEGGSTPAATIAGEILGTPVYMSPEQARLRADEVDARSDVYTLGVILYQLIANEFPYKVRGLPVPEIARVIYEDPPTPLREHVPDVAGDLQAITSKALEKAPDHRYQSVSLLAEDIRRFLSGQAVSVRNAGPVERLGKFVRRRPGVTAGIAGTVLALGVFSGTVTKLWLDARRSHHAEIKAHARAEAAHDRAETARVELERRNNQLTLRQARAALRRDPTEAVAWLHGLTERDVDPGTAWSIAEEAIARGVALDVIRAHSDQVHRVEPLPGGTGFVTAGYDSRAIVWTGTPAVAKATIMTKRGRVHSARPSPDGKLLAISGDAGEVLTSTLDGKTVIELTGHAGSVQDIAWSPDGAWLVTADERGNVYVWPRGAAPGKQLVVGKIGIAGVMFSTTSKELITGDLAGNLSVFDLASGTRRTATLGGELVTAWCDSKQLRVVDGTGAVRHYKLGATLTLESSTPTNIATKRGAFSPDGSWAVLGGVGGALVRVTGTDVERMTSFRAQVRSVAISADSRWLAAGTDDGSLELRDVTSGRVVNLRGHLGRVRDVSFTLDSRALLSSDSDGVVRVWALAQQASPILAANGLALNALAASEDGTQIAAVDAASTIWMWTLASAARVALGTSEGPVTHLAVRDDTVITGTAEGDVRFWGATTTEARIGGIVRGIAVTQNRVAVASSAGPITMFTLDGIRTSALPGHPGGTDALAFSADGKLVVSGGQDRKIRVWVADQTDKPPVILDGDLRGDTRFIVISPKNTYLAVAGNDGGVHTWEISNGVVDPASHKKIATHTGAVTALAFNDAGRMLVSGGRDATVTRTNLNGGAQVTGKLSNAPISLMFDSSDDVHAVTYSGAAERWTPGKPSIVEIDHGLYSGQTLRNGRWVLGFDDGSLLVTTRSSRPFAELSALLARATTFRR